MKQRQWIPLKTLSISLLIFLSLNSHADDQKSSWAQRAQDRQTKRWTLQEWLEQKEKNRMMDLWLAMNSSSPYESQFSIESWDYKQALSSQNGTTQNTLLGQAHFYSSIVGLGVEYAKFPVENRNDLSGLFNFRLFGTSIQSTHITLHYGLRTRTYEVSNQIVGLRNPFAQISLQLYLNKSFGIDSFYRSYFSTTDSAVGSVNGQSSEAFLFIDFKFLRIYGGYSQDVQVNNLNGIETKIDRSGIKSGLRIFY